MLALTGPLPEPPRPFLITRLSLTLRVNHQPRVASLLFLLPDRATAGPRARRNAAKRPSPHPGLPEITRAPAVTRPRRPSPNHRLQTPARAPVPEESSTCPRTPPPGPPAGTSPSAPAFSGTNRLTFTSTRPGHQHQEPVRPRGPRTPAPPSAHPSTTTREGGEPRAYLTRLNVPPIYPG